MTEGPPSAELEIRREPSGNRTGHRGGPPIHAASAALLVAVDNLWNLADWAVLTWLITIPSSFMTVAVPVFWIQRRLKGDPRARALAFAVLLGAIAAVPTSVTGTPAGLALLAWTGVSRLLGWGGGTRPKMFSF